MEVERVKGRERGKRKRERKGKREKEKARATIKDKKRSNNKRDILQEGPSSATCLIAKREGVL